MFEFWVFWELQYYFPDDVKGLIGCSYGPFKSLPDVVLIGFALKFQSLVLFDQVCFDFALLWKLYVGTFKQLKAVIHIQVFIINLLILSTFLCTLHSSFCMFYCFWLVLLVMVEGFC